MDQPKDSPNYKPDARQQPAQDQSVARLAQTGAVHLARLLRQAAIYLEATALDLIYAAHLGRLMRSQAKFPERAADFDAQRARLKEQRSRRWSSWQTLSGGRRLEIRFAATVIVVAAFFGVRAYLTRGGSPAQVAYQPAAAETPSAPSARSAASITTSSANSTVSQALLDARNFTEYRKRAAPGQWIVYGVKPVESVRANLAEADAQMKSAEATAKAANKELRVSVGKPSENAARAAYHAANEERRAKNRAYEAAQIELNKAEHPVVKPVLARGAVRDWDGFKVMSPVVMKEGKSYRMWYVGCHFLGADYTCGVGHAESRDGIAWTKSRAPVLTIDDRIVSQDLHSIAVVRAGDAYLMWYAIDSHPLHGNDCATLNLATSRDGLAWKPDGVVLSANCGNSAHLWQSAFSDGKTVHLWYADYDASSNGSLMHLISSGGKSWQKAGSTDIGTLGKDPRRLWVMPGLSVGYHALFAAPTQNGYFGMLQSPDGNAWTISDDAPKLTKMFDSGSDGKPEAPAAIVELGDTWMWFAVPNASDGSEEVGLAFAKAKSQ